MGSDTRLCGSTPAKELAFTNCVYLGLGDELAQQKYIRVNHMVFTPEEHQGVTPGSIGLSKYQRLDLQADFNQPLKVAPYEVRSGVDAVMIQAQVKFTAERAQGEFNATELTSRLVQILQTQMLTQNQQILFDMHGSTLVLKVNMIMGVDRRGESSEMSRGRVQQATQFVYEAAAGKLRITGQRHKVSQSLFKQKDFNFEKLGIGGLDSQFQEIFRRAFASRVYPPDIVERLGIKHVRGLLLFGPPGTGKTLIARQIGKILNANEPKIVNGPEVLNKYVGQSEENIRALFAEAEAEQAEKGPESSLHIIIFDEIDAITKARGTTGGGTGVNDTIVNQLLTKIDGVDALDNILLIGMTNRIDMIDEALLRPGRLEVQVEIGLPDTAGRLQILNIHTNKMRTNSFMDSNVDIEQIAEITKNYTGAELEGLVKAAVSFALSRQVDVSNISKPLDEAGIKVNMDDFDKALSEVKPNLGLKAETLDSLMQHGMVHYGERYDKMLDTLQKLAEQVKGQGQSRLVSCMLRGPPGCGKTALAAIIGRESQFPFVKVISAEDMVGYNEASKVSKISKIFTDSYKSPLSLIILDDIERLLEYVLIGPRFSNVVLQTLLVLIKKLPPPGRKLLVIGTSSMGTVMGDMGLNDVFTVVLDLPLLQQDEMERVINQVHAFHPKDVRQAVQFLPDAKMPIKRLFQLLEMARVGVPGGSVIPIQNWKTAVEDVGYLLSDWAKY